MIGDILEIEEENGALKKYNVLFKFDELDSNEHYVVYTDYSKSNDGNFNISARQYSIESEKIELTEVKHQEVKDYIKNKLNELLSN
ncbi:MAG: hypothetical protein IJH12_09615 [Clostridia bacterium]|nr:hypothetical protein [Clostridia bacterium]